MTRRKTWALVTNGVRARILRGLEGGDSEDPIELIARSRSPHLRRALSDKTGREPDPTPGSHPVLRDMQDFAQDTLSVLEGHSRAGRLDRLAIFADPGMLAVLRQNLPASLRAAVCLERERDLVGLPEAELRTFIIRTLEEEAPS